MQLQPINLNTIGSVSSTFLMLFIRDVGSSFCNFGRDTALITVEEADTASRFANVVSRLPQRERGLTEVLQFLNTMTDHRTFEDVDDLVDNMRNLGLQRIAPLEDHEQEAFDDHLQSLGYLIHCLEEDQRPSNEEILKDLPYALQGLKTSIFTWKYLRSGEISLDIPPTLPFPLIGLLYRLLEPAVLYKHLMTMIASEDEKDRKKARGLSLVRQAFSNAVKHELQNYLKLVGTIETEIRRNETSPVPLTIRRCLVLLHDATMGLRLLYSISQAAENLLGGQVLSLIYGYTYNGDEFISQFSNRLLETVSKPFYEMLNHWVSGGDLVDPYEEFFVHINRATTVWKDKFKTQEELVPNYMGKKVSGQVLEIGKTLYFIRVACADHEWIDQRRASFKAIQDYRNLEQMILDGYEQVVEHLNLLLRTKFHLDLHLQGLKDYMLLGKGDFVQLLVEEAAPTLDQPAASLLRHHLTAMLETAIRGSNAQYDSPEILGSIDARMLELAHGDIGWEVFTLEYRVKQPLDTVILDTEASREYLRVFNFLWRTKRASFSLYLIWKLIALSHRGYAKISLEQEWNEVQKLCQEMMHFIGEVQYFINFEVVEMAWAGLQRELLKGGGRLTVDQTISTHRKYLRQITHKGLLGSESLIGALHEILKCILSFCAMVQEMYNMSVGDLASEEASRFHGLYAKTAELKVTFENNVEQLVHTLERDNDNELRFLGVRLDFNRFYSTRRRSSSSTNAPSS
jgi:gamma-tubulin complex component 3